MDIAWGTSSKIVGLHPQSFRYIRSVEEGVFAFLKDPRKCQHGQFQDRAFENQSLSQSTENACDESGSRFGNLMNVHVP